MAASSPGQSLEDFGAEEGIPVYGLPMEREISIVKDFCSLWKLVRLMRQIRPDILHTHTPKASLLGMTAATITRVPVRIYHIHGLRFATARGFKRTLLRSTERIACMLAHRVICVSTSVREAVMSEGLCAANKIVVVGNGSINGVDSRNRFAPECFSAEVRNSVRAQHDIPSNALVVGFVGRFTREKGFEDLASAWRSLREQFPLAHLLLVGEAESGDPVSCKTEAVLRSDARVHQTAGWVHDTASQYAAMDVLALPSYREGFPYAPLEAAAMALPVVATNVTGCVDVVQDGITGTLVSPHNAQELARVIALYLSDPLLRQRHGEAARARVVRDFCPEDIWEATYREYARLLLDRNIVFPSSA